MSRIAAAEGFPVQEQLCSTKADVFADLIEDAYQGERERFNADMESADGDVFACRHDLRRAAGTLKMRALVDKLIKAEETAAGVRNRGFFMAGVAAGVKIAVLAGVTGDKTRMDIYP